MKKTILYTASALLLFAVSCKENGVPINMEEATLAEDSTYVGAIETPQAKRILIEELSGVACLNCPQGADKLEELDAANPGQLSIISIHTGIYSDAIKDKSKQNFQTDDGIILRKQVWAEEASKPAAAFDRLPIGSGTNKYFVEGYPDWSAKINQIKAMHPTTPVNLSLTSKYNEKKDQYDIEVTIKYTQAVTAQQALHIFLSEDKIVDVQQLSAITFDMNYEFNHVFRKAITMATTGKIFLADQETKVAGTVYIYRTSLKIDTSDPKQKFWTHPENMKVTAFVANIANDDKRVIQVQETKLIP